EHGFEVENRFIDRLDAQERTDGVLLFSIEGEQRVGLPTTFGKLRFERFQVDANPRQVVLDETARELRDRLESLTQLLNNGFGFFVPDQTRRRHARGGIDASFGAVEKSDVELADGGAHGNELLATHPQLTIDQFKSSQCGVVDFYADVGWQSKIDQEAI